MPKVLHASRPGCSMSIAYRRAPSSSMQRTASTPRRVDQLAPASRATFSIAPLRMISSSGPLSKRGEAMGRVVILRSALERAKRPPLPHCLARRVVVSTQCPLHFCSYRRPGSVACRNLRPILSEKSSHPLRERKGGDRARDGSNADADDTSTSADRRPYVGSP